MRIYLAGYFAAGRGMPTAASTHRRISTKLTYPHVLESYHYSTPGILAAIRHHQQKVFVDSGAYSAFTQGAKINLDRYAKHLQRNADIVETAANLDAIGGEDGAQQSYDNLRALERLVGPGLVIPVHHVRDHDDWLRRYLDAGYGYLGLGGMVPESTPVLRQWLDHVWGKILTHPNGTPRIKVHGFGLTNPDLMFRYPWYSVDSTTWLTASHYGAVLLDLLREDGSIKDYKIEFSTRSPKRYDADSFHFQSLPQDEQEVVVARLAELEAERIRDPDLEAAFKAELGCEMGINPTAMSLSYGVRDLVLFGYYQRAMARGVTSFIDPQPGLFG